MHMNEITINNIIKFNTQELNEALSSLCAPIFSSSTFAKALSYHDLEDVSAAIGKITSIRSYLMSLEIELDVIVRTLKSFNEKENPAYSKSLDKKKIIAAYIELLDNVFHGLSRQITIYQLQQTEQNMI